MIICLGLHHVEMAVQYRETVAFYRDVIGLFLVQ